MSKKIALNHSIKYFCKRSILDEHLRLPKSNFFVMGGLAALRIGPVARNIHGGKMSCRRIVPAIVKPSLAYV